MRYIRNVVTLQLDVKKCLGCRRCEEVCPHRVFAMNDMKASIKDRDACMECGACALNCPTRAISVKPGVGCAAAIIKGMLTGKEPSCDCSDDGCC
ncbi:MAG: 4Fe-4S binding protein [Methanomassiliicoccaceae archaeon]|jgi:NAD-dependent dihydropyrimidine dehydrogenase PreA subunit|nr:4Fe-4S binding protein [Methanomassiliicoccaceae archaeon]